MLCYKMIKIIATDCNQHWVHAFFYKNKLYKNTQDVTQIIKNNVQPPGWNFDQTNLRNLFNPCPQIEMVHVYKDLLELAGWKNDKQVHDV